MIALVEVGNAGSVGAAGVDPSAADVATLRERELDLMAADIEGAARGLGVFLLLALIGVAFVVMNATGLLV